MGGTLWESALAIPSKPPYSILLTQFLTIYTQVCLIVVDYYYTNL